MELTAGEQSLAEVKIQRSISPLLFVIAMMPLNHIIRKCTGYKLNKSQKKINLLMFISDKKIFAKNEKKLETLIQTVRIYSQDIGMEYFLEKCAMLIKKSVKRHITEGVELPNQVIRTRGEKKTYKWGFLELTPLNNRKFIFIYMHVCVYS